MCRSKQQTHCSLEWDRRHEMSLLYPVTFSLVIVFYSFPCHQYFNRFHFILYIPYIHVLVHYIEYRYFSYSHHMEEKVANDCLNLFWDIFSRAENSFQFIFLSSFIWDGVLLPYGIVCVCCWIPMWSFWQRLCEIDSNIWSMFHLRDNFSWHMSWPFGSMRMINNEMIKARWM